MSYFSPYKSSTPYRGTTTNIQSAIDNDVSSSSSTSIIPGITTSSSLENLSSNNTLGVRSIGKFVDDLSHTAIDDILLNISDDGVYLPDCTLPPN